MTERIQSSDYNDVTDLLTDKEKILLEQANLLAGRAKEEEKIIENPLKMTIETHLLNWINAMGIFLVSVAKAFGSIHEEPAETYTNTLRRVGTIIIDSASQPEVFPYLGLTLVVISFLFILFDFMESYVNFSSE